MLQAFAIVSSFSNRINLMDIMATVYWFRSETKSVLFLDSEAKNAASFTLDENLLAILFRTLLGVFRNRITRNRRYSCSFGSYFVFGLNGISFRSFCSRIRLTRNTQNTRSFGKCLAGNPTRPPTPVAWLPVGRRSSSQVTSAMTILFSE